MSSSRPALPKPLHRHRNLWLERFMAIAVATNMVLIVFDLTYVSLRNFWLLGNLDLIVLKVPIPLPPPPPFCHPIGDTPPEKATLITQCYDPIKGIEGHRDTEAYLATVRKLEGQIEAGGLNALTTPEVEDTLQDLGQLSTEMIGSNPFQVAEKSGTLEKIKNLMRERMKSKLAQLPPGKIKNPFPSPQPTSSPQPASSPQATSSPQPASSPQATSLSPRSPSKAVNLTAPPNSPTKPLLSSKKVSASDSFRVFWSPTYLTADNWKQEIGWFNQNVRPLVQTNYYRSTSETGGFTNRFWLIDAPFWSLFVLEFLARTFYISRRYTGVSWLGAMTWRWYDIPLIVPFGVLFPSWAWLRVLPLVVRLHQSQLVNMEQVTQQASQGFVGSIAEEITQVVVVQVLDQVQGVVQRGDLSRLILQSTQGGWVDKNNVDEVAEISSLLLKTTVYEVFPKIQPDLEALLRHNVDSVLSQSPAYQALKTVPGVGGLPTQLSDRIITEVVQGIYKALTSFLEDPVSLALVQKLVRNLGTSFSSELQQQQVISELQKLLTDLLDELKLSYMKQTTDVSTDAIMEKTRQLKQIARGG